IGSIFAVFGAAGAATEGALTGFLTGAVTGVVIARLIRSSKIVLFICDTLQTFPSFIYLIPAIMLFRVGELAIIFAIIPYAMVPAVRYTYLGLKRIPEVTLEAAGMSGATPMQQLWKVRLPIALPEIMLGVNQTIMMALAMTAITALIGGTDLGQEIYRALPSSDAGRGVMAGLGIAALGIVADRLIGAWAAKRKAALGIA
ncbi:MAG: ABC transporter permease subunit, partial [Pseudomonadota bacterium]